MREPGVGMEVGMCCNLFPVLSHLPQGSCSWWCSLPCLHGDSRLGRELCLL